MPVIDPYKEGAGVPQYIKDAHINLRRQAAGLPLAPIIPERGFTGLADDRGIVGGFSMPGFDNSPRAAAQLRSFQPIFQAREDAARQRFLNSAINPQQPRQRFLFADSFGGLEQAGLARDAARDTRRNASIAQIFQARQQAQQAKQQGIANEFAQEQAAIANEQAERRLGQSDFVNQLRALGGTRTGSGSSLTSMLSGGGLSGQPGLNDLKFLFDIFKEERRVGERNIDQAREREREELALFNAEEQAYKGAESYANQVNQLIELDQKMQTLPTPESIALAKKQDDRFGPFNRTDAREALIEQIKPLLPPGTKVDVNRISDHVSQARQSIASEREALSERLEDLAPRFSGLVAVGEDGRATVNLTPTFFDPNAEDGGKERLFKAKQDGGGGGGGATSETGLIESLMTDFERRGNRFTPDFSLQVQEAAQVLSPMGTEVLRRRLRAAQGLGPFEGLTGAGRQPISVPAAAVAGEPRVSPTVPLPRTGIPTTQIPGTPPPVNTVPPVTGQAGQDSSLRDLLLRALLGPSPTPMGLNPRQTLLDPRLSGETGLENFNRNMNAVRGAAPLRPAAPPVGAIVEKGGVRYTVTGINPDGTVQGTPILE